MENGFEAEAIAAEHEMFADVLSELFLSVLGEHQWQPWFDAAVQRLSRGAAGPLWSSLTAAHAAGMRLDPLAAGQAAAIELLCAARRRATV